MNNEDESRPEQTVLLLERALHLYDKYEAGQEAPFNIFSTLRKERDEVNLHSRFLHALLNYQKASDAPRQNLKSFLQRVVKKDKDFAQSGIEVERERDNIDILITNDVRQAILIENKIGAGDQPQQLQRYHDRLRKRGFDDISLLYLTLDGYDPSEDSIGTLYYQSISYRDDLPPWLEGCQKRAYDEPALRESIAQYLQLVRKLTGTDFSEAYMKDLEELCLQDNNPTLIHNLNEAVIRVRVSLLKKLCGEIDSALTELISKMPTDKNKNREFSEAAMEKYVRGTKGGMYYGLFYPFGSGDTEISVEFGSEIDFGIYYDREKDEAKYSRLKEALKNVKGGKSNRWWPWYRCVDGRLDLRNPTPENLKLVSRLLSNEEERKKYVEGIIHRLKPAWDAVKEL